MVQFFLTNIILCIVTLTAQSQYWTFGISGGQRLSTSIYSDPQTVGSTTDLHHFTFYDSKWITGIKIGYKSRKVPIHINLNVLVGDFVNILYFKNFSVLDFGIDDFDKIKIPYRVWEGSLSMKYNFLSMNEKSSLGLLWGFSSYYTLDDNLFGFRSGQLETISFKDGQTVVLDYGYQRDKYEEYGLSINTGFYYEYNISTKFFTRLNMQYAMGLKTGQSFWFLYSISDDDQIYSGDAISYMNWDNIRFLISLNYKI